MKAAACVIDREPDRNVFEKSTRHASLGKIRFHEKNDFKSPRHHFFSTKQRSVRAAIGVGHDCFQQDGPFSAAAPELERHPRRGLPRGEIEDVGAQF